ncbi:hypothetical protein ACQEV4_22935 [Streptomyces shenzhenensis]|uniref:hypothetical protein n=1 Tax=Streptomyces shenzhenensis TaxID=943815 RepID=UPI003D8DB242
MVDLNRQSLDRIVPDIQIERLRGMFAAAGWQVVVLKWGRVISELFARPGGEELRRRLEEMPNEEYQRMLRVDSSGIADRICGATGSADLKGLLASLTPDELAAAVRDLGGHDLGLLVDTFDTTDTHRPTVVFAYTVKGRGLPTEGHPNNHSALLTEAQMRALAASCGTSLEDPWSTFGTGTAAGGAVRPAGRTAAALPLRRGPARRGADVAGTPVPQGVLDPGRARPAAGRPGPGRPGGGCPGRDVQPRCRVLDEPRRLDQQDRRVVGLGTVRLVRRRRRTCPAVVGGPQRTAHRTRHRRGEPRLARR